MGMKAELVFVYKLFAYEAKLEKMCAKYVLKEKVEIDGKRKNIVLLDTFRIVDVVNFLLEELNGGE